MTSKKLVVFLLCCTLILSACGQAEPPAANVAQAAPSDTPAPSNTPTATLDLAATQSAQQTAAAQAEADTRATQFAARQTDAAAARGATATAKAGIPLTKTAEAQATSDAIEAAFQGVIDGLYKQGIIQSSEGEYFNFGDFEDEMAQINTPFVEFLHVSGENFIISADMAWESASDNANWPTSGCGFIYGYKDSYNADLTFLGLDGYTRSLQFRDDRPVSHYALRKWGEPERPKGEASAMLVMWDQRVTVFVNDEIANEFHNGLYKGGDIGLNIFSGTNKGFGTRCSFSNIQVMIFE